MAETKVMGAITRSSTLKLILSALTVLSAESKRKLWQGRQEEKNQPRSQGLSSLPPLLLRKRQWTRTMESERRDPGNEVGEKLEGLFTSEDLAQATFEL